MGRCQTAGIDPKRAFLAGPGTEAKRQERPFLKQAANMAVRPFAAVHDWSWYGSNAPESSQIGRAKLWYETRDRLNSGDLTLSVC